MAADLFTPILNDRTRAVRFFNGRLLSGEAMTDEQSAQRAARALLAQTVGDGIAHGFDVVESKSSTTPAPVLTVAKGVALNRRGEILLLAGDTEVQLVRPPHRATAPASLFQTCVPPREGVYVADSGVYLLTVCSIGAANGLAEVSGLGGIAAGCNAKYVVDAVQFRLLELPVAGPVLSDVAHLRNRVAYQCFGVDGLLAFVTDPFGTAGEPRTLLDTIRDSGQLTDCDVPLALMYWTATGGIQFVDMWSVRRRVTRTAAAASSAALSDVRIATAEAMVLQFQEQIAAIALTGAESIQASAGFRYLPPAGLLPVRRGSLPGFTVDSFFKGIPHRQPKSVDAEYVDAASVTSLLREAVQHPPIDVQSKQFVWLYSVWQNAAAPARTRAGVIFASPYTRYRGSARFDLAHWDYSNYSNCCDGVSS